jgi:hypothetical protein
MLWVHNPRKKMKKVILGVYCNAHFDLPAVVSNELDITTLTKSRLNDLILNGKIKFLDETTQDLMNGMDLNESGAELFESSFCCGSFNLSKINYIMENLDVNLLKK